MDELDLERMIYRDVDPVMLMQRIVEGAPQLVNRCDGAAILIDIGSELRTVCAAGLCRAQLGEPLPIESSLSGLAFRSGELAYSPDVRTDERVHAELRLAPGRSMLAVPLRRGAEVVGVLVIVSRVVGAFAIDARTTVDRVAGFVGVTLGSMMDTANAARALLATLDGTAADDRNQVGDRVGEFLANVLRPGSADRLRVRQRVGSIVRDALVRVVGQPVVDIESGRFFAIEALARVGATPYRAPDVWIGEAHDAGVGLDLESLAVRRALELLDGLPDGTLLGINVSHDLLVSGRVQTLLADCPGERIMLELTEHTVLDDYARVREAMAPLAARGMRLAVDDVGAGYSSFRHVVELAPDYIKLDRVFTQGIETDPSRRAMAEALITFARATRIRLVAEGIETERQLDVMHELGIRLGQGFLIARPSDDCALEPEFETLLDRRPRLVPEHGLSRYRRRVARERARSELDLAAAGREPEPDDEGLQVGAPPAD